MLMLLLLPIQLLQRVLHYSATVDPLGYLEALPSKLSLPKPVFHHINKELQQGAPNNQAMH